MVEVVNLGLRVLEFLWTLIIMALTGNIIADAIAGNPSSINYAMFVAVFSMLCLFYLFLVAFKEDFAIHPLIPVILDALNTLFFFAAGVALAARLHVHSCSNQQYLKSNEITNGAVNKGKRCREAQAVTAFLWFGFATYAASLFFSFLSARSGGANFRSAGVRKGGPAMSQV